MRVTERLRHAVYSAYYKARNLNYSSRYGYPTTKAVGDISFRSYELYSLHGRDDLLHELVGRVDAGDVFFDVGANVGVYSCAAAATGATVHAFEPNPEAREKLRANLDANGFGDGTDSVLHSFALSDTDGTATFHVSSYPEVSSLRRANATVSGGRVVTSFETETRRLDTAVERLGLPPPDHLKVDVEGSGIGVLRGAEETLAEARPTVYFEPHGNAEEAREMLEGAGYAVEQTEDGDFVAEPTE